MEPTELTLAIRASLGGEFQRIGGKPQYVPAFCPYCGRDNQRDFHSSYGQIFPEGGHGYKCFSCGTTVSLYSLAIDVGAITDAHSAPKERYTPKPPPEPRPKPIPLWKKQGMKMLRHFDSHRRYDAWYAHKKVTREVVDKYRLGIGVLPSCRCPHERLIVPIIQNDELVMLRGRRIDCDCPKWLPSAGASPKKIGLVMGEKVIPGGVTFVTENPVDAILINEMSPYQAVSTLSTVYWYKSWQEELASRHPGLVVVAFDADVPGNGLDSEDAIADEAIRRVAKKTGLTSILVTKVRMDRKGWKIYWRSGDRTGIEKIAAPAGIRLLNKLVKSGIPAHRLTWDKPGQDMGQVWQES